MTSTPDSLIPPLDGTVLEITQAGSQLLAHTSPSQSASTLKVLYWGDRILWKGKRVSSYLEIYLGDGRKAYVTDNPQYVIERDLTQTTPGVQVGATITITADGNNTHLRVDTSTQAKEAKKLIVGDKLSVVGGPRYSEYYVWWQLRLPNGTTGWQVDVPGWWDVF